MATGTPVTPNDWQQVDDWENVGSQFGGFDTQQQQKDYLAGSKVPMREMGLRDNPDYLSQNLKAAGAGAALGAGGAALGTAGMAGAVARGAGGYLVGQGLEAAGAPPWLGELLGLLGGGGGLIKAGAKKLGGKFIEKEVADAVKRRAISGAMGATEKAAAGKVIGAAEAEAGQAAKATPRVLIGAEKAGRPLGMTKEQVRMETGPVLDEALGEASPILPKNALKSIIDTMKAMPMAEREAYVARATSGKSKWQIENVRRTLEHLGLLLPLGAAGAYEGGQ